MILSDNSIAHLLIALACLHVGVPYSPVSPAYSLLATDFAKLRQCAALLTPGLVFAAEGPRIRGCDRGRHPGGCGGGHNGRCVPLAGTQLHSASCSPRRPTAAVDAAAERVGPDHIAKILFTSGSTGVPKGVINTHRMLCSNQQMIRQSYPVLEEEPPVLLDWLPWSHTFGGNHDLGIVLANGGTFYIDDGRPVPGKFEATVRNLCDVSPTAFYSVPKAFEELGARMEHDAVLRERFFARIRYLFYAGAGLPQQTWDTFERLAVETIGQRIQWMTGLGSTETAPFALSPRPDVVGAGIVGLPAPGVELKLAPVNGKMEARVRGPSITPGYWRMPEQTAKAFDDEGFYRMGDALVPVDANDLSLAFRFDGRVSEDFKLLTGTWVSVGPLAYPCSVAFGAARERRGDRGHESRLCGGIGHSAKCGGGGGSGGVRRGCRSARSPGRAGDRQLHPGHAPGVADCAAVHRCRRTHGQRVYQSARRAEQLRRSGRAALRRTAPSACDLRAGELNWPRMTDRLASRAIQYSSGLRG